MQILSRVEAELEATECDDVIEFDTTGKFKMVAAEVEITLSWK